MKQSELELLRATARLVFKKKCVVYLTNLYKNQESSRPRKNVDKMNENECYIDQVGQEFIDKILKRNSC